MRFQHPFSQGLGDTAIANDLLPRAQLAADVDFGESEDLEGLEEVWSGVVYVPESFRHFHIADS